MNKLSFVILFFILKNKTNKKKNRTTVKNLRIKKVIVCNALIITCILFLSVGFSAFQNNVHIKDLAVTVRINEDNRISGINILSAYDGTSFYEDYNVSNIVSKVNLNSAGSYIIYNVDVYNLGNVLMEIKNININKENLKVEVLNYDLKTKLM